MADIIWLHPIQMHHIRQWNEKQIKYIHLLFTTGYLHTIHLAMAPQIAYVGFGTLQVGKSEPVPANTAPVAGTIPDSCGVIRHPPYRWCPWVSYTSIPNVTSRNRCARQLTCAIHCTRSVDRGGEAAAIAAVAPAGIPPLLLLS